MGKPDTWMPLYVGDYLTDTSRLGLEHHGAYLLLLMDYWRNGPPPDDDDVLARILSIKPLRFRRKIRPILAPFFVISGGVWTHGRVEAERARAVANAAAASEKASHAATVRWSKPRAGPMLGALPEQCPSPSPSSVPTEQALAPLDPNKEAWARASALLVGPGKMKEAGARRFFGKLLKDHGVEARVLLPAIVRCEGAGTEDPQSYLRACASRLRAAQGGESEVDVSKWDADTWADCVRRWRERGADPAGWPDYLGPPPGAPGCAVPREVLVTPAAGAAA